MSEEELASTEAALAGACPNSSETIFPVNTSTGQVMCPPYQNPFVFLSPHQDDESLGMAGAIRQAVLSGRPVFVELMSDGATTGVVTILKNGKTDTWHSGTHSYSLTTAQMAQARNREFVDAVTRLGVTGYRLNPHPYPLQESQVTERINFWKRNTPNGMTLRGIAGGDVVDPGRAGEPGHLDHEAVWKALLASGEPSVLGYLVYHYRQKQGTPSYRQDISALCADKRTALNAYKVWNPSQGRYAVGYHSVKDLFDLSASDCGEYVITPPSTTPPPQTQTRQVPIASIPTSGSCGASCVTALNTDDGRYMRWLACTNGTLTSTEYANPTTFVFSVPEAARVTSAAFAIDAKGAGSNAVHEVTCLNGAGQVLATSAASFKFSTTATVNKFNVPLACFAETNVRIRLRRTGSNCVEADYARLAITYRP